MSEKTVPGLDGVPETMLWTLWNRAMESKNSDPFFKDELAEKVLDSLDYPFEKKFGRPHISHPIRAKEFDTAISSYLATHPQGPVVDLGCGVETQFFRMSPAQQAAKWFFVDVEESIALRTRLLPAFPENAVNIPKSALDFSWLDQIPENEDGHLFCSMQGLIMYFEEEQTKQLFQKVKAKFPKVTFMFDFIPEWLSARSMGSTGFMVTSAYRAPHMPFGANAVRMQELVKEWVDPSSIQVKQYWDRGARGMIWEVVKTLPWIGVRVPAMIIAKCGKV